MYYDENDTPAMARTSNLNEELGQVSKYLLNFQQYRFYLFYLVCIVCNRCSKRLFAENHRFDPQFRLTTVTLYKII